MPVSFTKDLTVIMAEIFLLRVQDESVVKEIVKEYQKTPAFVFNQESLLRLTFQQPHLPYKPVYDLINIAGALEGTIARAVQLNAEVALSIR